MILYKYRDWDNEWHQQNLKDYKIYMSAPSDFNDPFDCKIQRNYLTLDSDIKKDEYANLKILEAKPYIDPAQLPNIKKALRNGLNDLVKYQIVQGKLDFDIFDQHYGIYSLSKKANSILMWSHYANNHRGICIGFDLTELLNTKEFNLNSFVEYDDSYPVFNLTEAPDELEKAKKFTCFKAKDWQYEQEYRLVKIFWPDIPNDENRLLTLPHSCIKEVICGLNIKDTHFNEIAKLCESRGIKLFRVYKEQFKFEINLVEV